MQLLLRRVLVKGFQHLEWCFWRFCYKGDGANGSRTDSRKRAFHEAAALVFVLIQIDTVFGRNAEIMCHLALNLFDLLAEREAVYRKGSKNISLQLLADRFASWIAFFSQIKDQNIDVLDPFERQLYELNVEEKEDIDNSIEALIDGISHFLQCLYGVDFAPSADSDWTNRWRRDVPEEECLKKADLPQLWHYLSPSLTYLQSREGDLHIFAKLRPMLAMIMDLVELPSDEILNDLSLDAFITAQDESIDRDLNQGMFPGLLKTRIEDRDVTVGQMANIDIHEHLYYYHCLSVLEDDMDLEEGNGILGENGMELLDNYVKWMKIDLCFNPDRYWTWECLAIHYKDAMQFFISSCIQNIAPRDFMSSQSLNEKWRLLLCGHRRCFLVAQVLAEAPGFEEEKRYVQEMLLELDWILLTHPPPFQHRDMPVTLSSEQHQLCLSAQSRLNALLDGNLTPSWQLLLNKGKLVWKMKEKGWEKESLWCFSESVKAAIRDAGGQLDPLCKLHASRLKLLLMGFNDWTVLAVHGFDSQEAPEDENTAQASIFEDCRSALEFCRVKMSSYHRVHYHLAKAFDHKGNYSGALSHIQQLFVKGRKKFCISFGPIDPRQFRSSQRAASGGNPPIKISGSGVEEPVWKFASRVRKYLKLYMRLVYAARDVEWMGSIADALGKGDFDGPSELIASRSNGYRYPCLVDMPQRAMGMKLLLIHDGIQESTTAESNGKIEHTLNSITCCLFERSIVDTEYLSLASFLEQWKENASGAIQSMTENVFRLFAAAYEVLCESQGNLKTSTSSYISRSLRF